MPCFVANCAVVNSPRCASSATFALKSAEYRFRLLVIQVRLSQKRTELNLLSEFRGPPQTKHAAKRATAGSSVITSATGWKLNQIRSSYRGRNGEPSGATSSA